MHTGSLILCASGLKIPSNISDVYERSEKLLSLVGDRLGHQTDWAIHGNFSAGWFRGRRMYCINYGELMGWKACSKTAASLLKRLTQDPVKQRWSGFVSTVPVCSIACIRPLHQRASASNQAIRLPDRCSRGIVEALSLQAVQAAIRKILWSMQWDGDHRSQDRPLLFCLMVPCGQRFRFKSVIRLLETCSTSDIGMLTRS